MTLKPEHWRAAIACLEAAAADEREPDRYRVAFQEALEAFREAAPVEPVSAVPGRSHITHNIQRQDRRRLELNPGGGWSLGAQYSIIYCTGCSLRVKMPDGQADVGAAVARWDATNRLEGK